MSEDLGVGAGLDLEEVSEDLRQRVRLLLVGQSKVEAAWGRVHRQGPPERLLACRSPPAPQRLRLDADAGALPTVDSRGEVRLLEELLPTARGRPP